MKVAIVVHDGVGLKNFVFTDFTSVGQEAGYDLKIWNDTVFPVKESLGLAELKMSKARSSIYTDIIKQARAKVELRSSYKRTRNEAYLSYDFPLRYNTLKRAIKSSLVQMFTMCSIDFLRKEMYKAERRSTRYDECKKQLAGDPPKFIFFTNQRHIKSVSPVLAAQDLGIPTGTFIFSWDNLPKGMMVVETDYYFVWSEYMKRELLAYYPFISEQQIRIVGTPQFTPHFSEHCFQSRDDFLRDHGLDPSMEYICFSGDDVTTSPNDPKYLADVADAVRDINAKGVQQYGIIFRKCPVDFSGRYETIIADNKDIVFSVDPVWSNTGSGWDSAMPSPQDMACLANTVRHTKTVINLGSSMALDFACQGKTACYLNYDVEDPLDPEWRVDRIYKFIHFKSMDGRDPVYWVDSKDQIADTLLASINDSENKIISAKAWLNRISQPPHHDANHRFWRTIRELVI
ncbi:hypothetical protein OAF99_01735 [Akkermansiaceae bacterium]|nr:hypothetical protein [Akkermansiaceae bacterium]